MFHEFIYEFGCTKVPDADEVGAEPARVTDSESDWKQFQYPGIH